MWVRLAGLRAYAKQTSRAGRPMGHSAKSLCEIGLMAPSNIHEKTPDVSLMAYGRCGRAECVPPSALGPCYSASGLLPKPPHGGPGVEPNPSRHACRSLPSSALNHSAAGLSACLIMHHHRGMSTSRVKWLGTEVVCEYAPSLHGSMDEVRRPRPSGRALLAELWRVFPPQPSNIRSHTVNE